MAESEITFELPIDQEKVAKFAHAVGESAPVYFDQEAAMERGLPGPIAPPTFTVTQIFQVPREERETRLGSGLEYSRVLHGEQEFVYTRLPLVGEVLKGRMRVSKDFVKEGKRGGSMRFVTYETRFVDGDGEEVLSGHYTLIETAKDPGS